MQRRPVYVIWRVIWLIYRLVHVTRLIHMRPALLVCMYVSFIGLRLTKTRLTLIWMYVKRPTYMRHDSRDMYICIYMYMYTYICIYIYIYIYMYMEEIICGATAYTAPIWTCDVTDSYVAWLIHMCNRTHSHVWRDSFICVTWLIHMCDVIHSYVWRDSFIYVTWLIHM